MNLSWLAAVLAPHDVAPHANFTESARVRRPEVQLAAVVESQSTERQARMLLREGEGVPYLPLDAPPLDPTVELVARTLQAPSIRTAVPELVKSLTVSPPKDLAQRTALALISCVGLAELEDYGTCFAMIEDTLAALDVDNSPDARLLRAVLHVQRALRNQDAATSDGYLSPSVLDLLSSIDVQQLAQFTVSEGIQHTSARTLHDILDLQASAALSLMDPEELVALGAGRTRVWVRQVKSFGPTLLLRNGYRRGQSYSSMLESAFDEELGAGGRYAIVNPDQDIYYGVLALELAGHAAARPARTQLAIQRMLDAASGSHRDDLDDCLRLLRQANSKKHLDRALDWLRRNGPLEALARDARHVLRRARSSARVRSVEVMVLGGAADLLTESEANEALDLVFPGRSGFRFPDDTVGFYGAEFERRGRVYAATASLAVRVGATEEFLSVLRRQYAEFPAGDQLLDQRMATAIRLLSAAEAFAALDSRTRVREEEAWTDWLSTSGAVWRISAAAVADLLGMSGAYPIYDSDLSRVASDVDAVIRGAHQELLAPEFAVRVTRASLEAARSEAAEGRHSFGGLPEADIAAALIASGGLNSLWDDLAEYLCDERVSRRSKAPAFDRLALSTVDIPRRLVDEFERSAEGLLGASDDVLFERRQTVPFPSALRFLASNGLLPPARVAADVASLAGSPVGEARREGAWTLAVLARRAPDTWQMPIALQLSYDALGDVRARAGQALVEMLEGLGGDVTSEAALLRVRQLLRQDGFLVPKAILRSLRSSQLHAHPQLAQSVSDMLDHPSGSVRREALNLLDT